MNEPYIERRPYASTCASSLHPATAYAREVFGHITPPPHLCSPSLRPAGQCLYCGTQVTDAATCQSCGAPKGID